MSVSDYAEYPDELTVSVWEKQKNSGFDEKSDVAEKLKALQKKHGAVDWKLFADGWTKSAKTATELEAEGSKRDSAYRSSVLPLKKEAQAVASLAKTAEKKADKTLLTTLKAIGKAADSYADGVEKCAVALKDAYEKAQDKLPEDDDDESEPSALIDPKVLYKQLNMCRKDPERTMKFAFVDAKESQPAMLAMHPRMSARALFGKLQLAAGVKTGAYGSAWVDGMSLMLQQDKPLSGLVKKIRTPVKACKFKITKVVLWNEDGTVLEQDEQHEDEEGDGQAQGPDGKADANADAAREAQRAYTQRRAALEPRLEEALRDPKSDQSRLRAVRDFADEKAIGGQIVAAMKGLDALEKLLPESGSSSGETDTTTDISTAGEKWSQAHEHAVAVLKQVARDIAALKDPESAAAITAIGEAIKKLPAQAPVADEAAALRSLIEKDDLFADVSEFAADIKTPMLKALAAID